MPIKPRIYTSRGVNDTLYEANIRFSEEMYKLNFDFTFESLAGAHDWPYFNKALEQLK